MSDDAPPVLPAYVERLCGGVVAVVGALLYGVVIPMETETVSYGWTRPETIPNIAALTLVLAGLWQAAAPQPGPATGVRQWARAGAAFGATIALVVALRYVDFRIAGPVFVAALMLFIGERRPIWLIAGVVVFPIVLWALVVLVLGRPLP